MPFALRYDPKNFAIVANTGFTRSGSVYQETAPLKRSQTPIRIYILIALEKDDNISDDYLKLERKFIFLKNVSILKCNRATTSHICIRKDPSTVGSLSA